MTEPHSKKQPVPLRIEAAQLHAFVCAIWEQAGSAPREAALVADHLVGASLTGHDSHGVGMIPRYVASMRDNELKLNLHAEVVRDAGAVLTIEGNKGFGQVVAFEAMELGIARAKKLGVCAVGLRGAHHIGRIGHWAEQCAAAGLVSFHFVNVAGDPLVAPFGGTDRRIGTNPFCAAFPRTGRPPLVLDFATSAIAYGKARVAFNQGKATPPGSLIDHEGRASVDPRVMMEAPFGSLTPMGGHKGFGLAAMCEIFGGALSGGFTTHADTLGTTNAIVNCMLSVILDPNAFDAPNAEAEADAFLEWVKASPLAAGTGQIFAPGEPERATRAERSAAGVPVDPATWQQILDAAREAGMPASDVDTWARKLH
ncbi:malate/lactate/ureidoglycolate dehydrogenase [Paraburkholderia saeva]|uniref:malate/lactate/ureidoglycolate dehydrogenase n=1 Tax=Paraburkholderia saeva TaxID=2777537 RepID=UPI001D822F61|nr:malate/lactate/ureidoglycolate dehydrogenase [Paraburkholderia saeva]CAG4889089.1 Hydroxycarboxylate dehydrogenase B [Paraburkholderia saeva]